MSNLVAITSALARRQHARGWPEAQALLPSHHSDEDAGGDGDAKDADVEEEEELEEEEVVEDEEAMGDDGEEDGVGAAEGILSFLKAV